MTSSEGPQRPITRFPVSQSLKVLNSEGSSSNKVSNQSVSVFGGNIYQLRTTEQNQLIDGLIVKTLNILSPREVKMTNT